MEALLGAAVPALEASMRFRLARQGLLAANVANVDTPGYRRVDLRFDAALGQAQQRLLRTHPAHRTGTRDATHGHRLEEGPASPRPDRNGVELERESLALSRNAGTFVEHATVLSRLLVLTRTAISGEAR